MQSWYRSFAFWTLIVGTIVSVLGGLHYNLEAEALAAIAGQVIAYLVARGIVARAVVEAASRTGFKASEGTIDGF